MTSRECDKRQGLPELYKHSKKKKTICFVSSSVQRTMHSVHPCLRARFAAILISSIFQVAAWPQEATTGSIAQSAAIAATGTVQGRVLDEAGAAVAAAPVKLEFETGEFHTTHTDAEGSYSFSALPAGEFALTATARGFASFTNPRTLLAPGQTLQLADIALSVAPLSVHAEVTASKREVAEAQMQSEVKQRLIGFLPNYYVVYFKDPAPLSAGQKMRLAFRLVIDPVTFGIDAAQAAAETNSKNYEEYGTGAEGFAKRYAAAYADDFIGTVVGSGLMHVVFRQDPRYYYKGSGSVHSRVLYALSWSFRCKGDNGKWQVNYSSLLGDIASASISNLYYPKAIRNSAGETVKYSVLGLASQSVNALLQEFLFKKITTHSNDPGKF